MMEPPAVIGKSQPRRIAIVMAVLAAATVGAALVFEHGFGYTPCPLCLQERWPYYIGAPLALAMAAIAGRVPRPIMVAGFAGLALLYLGSAGLGAYHAGVEWKFWAGPTGCSGGAVTPSAGSLLGQLQATARVARCDEASWHFLGLSFAGWNVVASLALAALAMLGLRRAQGSSSVSQ